MPGNPLIDSTHDPELRSWVDSANGHPEFPVQNLPLCIFAQEGAGPRGGVAIGDQLLDLRALASSGLMSGNELALIETAAAPTLNSYCALTAADRVRLRKILSNLLSDLKSPLRSHTDSLFVALDAVSFEMPATVGDYSDFFAGIHHARNAGRMFRPDNPLLPNYWHVPIAYHGRASSIDVSGKGFPRPVGQTAAHGSTTPHFGPSKRVDFELELAIWIGGGNRTGEPIPIDKASDAIVGFGLLNDWSARDIQAWETQPLGPFLGKSFYSTVSPFLVTVEALAPFRRGMPSRGEGEPAPMAYLWDELDQQIGVFDCHLEVLISTEKMRAAGAEPVVLTEASGKDLVWTPAQMVAHHTVTGCNLRPGDLFGTGTVSSPGPKGHGSMLEMTEGGRVPLTLPNGEQRSFLEDGDEVIMRGWCEAEGYARIGLGEARGTVGPSLPYSD